MDLAILEYRRGDTEDAKTAITQAISYTQTPLIDYIYNALSHNQPLHLKVSGGQIIVSGN